MSDPSLKPQGPWEVCRRFKIPAFSQPADAIPLERALSEIPGIRSVSIDGSKHRLKVRYSITETDYQAIAGVLEANGFPTANGWWDSLRSSWLQNLDLTGRENASVKPSACCNRPPVPSSKTGGTPTDRH
jgi:hypothetical protein